VLPHYGQMVIFLSERFPHEVSALQRERFSLTGWYRVNNSQQGRIAPPVG
jgi:SM-20-related protein